MSQVVIDLSMSLDGFIAGPNDGPEAGLGERGGEHIFDWFQGGEKMYGRDEFAPVGANRDVVDEMYRATGAMLTGRRTYDITRGWNGRHPIEGLPVVIVTHHPPQDPPQGPSQLVFVSSVAEGVARAKQLAHGKRVAIGGASVAQAALREGLVDEVLLHVAPIILGAGVQLFDKLGDAAIRLELTQVIHGPGVVHQHYRVRR